MTELADVQDLGSCGVIRVGSTPTTRTKVPRKHIGDVLPFFHTAEKENA